MSGTDTTSSAGWTTRPWADSLLNLPRAQSAMRQLDVCALVTTSPENVTYLTGYDNWPLYTLRNDLVLAIVDAEGRRALVVPMAAGEYLAELPPDDCRIFLYGTFVMGANPDGDMTESEEHVLALRAGAEHRPKALAAVAAAAQYLGVSEERVLLDASGLTVETATYVEKVFSWAVAVSDPLDVFRAIRLIKTDHEVVRLRRAAAGVEAAMVAAFVAGRPGVSEAELERVVHGVSAMIGVNPGHCELTVGTRSGGCFPASSRQHLKQGDAIRADIGGRLRGYWSDTGKTAALGQMDARLESIYAALKAGVEEMLAVARDGVAAADVTGVGLAAVHERGLPSYDRHHAGHGIGLEMYEQPIMLKAPVDTSGAFVIDDVDPSRLAAGMVVNFELPYYEAGRGGLQIEDTVLITPDGCTRLTTASQDIHRLP